MNTILTGIASFGGGVLIALYFAYQAWRSSSTAGDAKTDAANAVGEGKLLLEKLAERDADIASLKVALVASQARVHDLEVLYASTTSTPSPDSQSDFVRSLPPTIDASQSSTAMPKPAGSSAESDALLNPFLPQK